MIWKLIDRVVPVVLGRILMRRSPLATPSVGSSRVAIAVAPDSESE